METKSYYAETSQFLQVWPFVLLTPSILNIIITDDPILLAAFVTVFRSQNTEARKLKVSVNINHLIANVFSHERYIENQTP